MNEIEKFVKDVVYGGIGAAATIVEKSGDIARSLVEKGQETVRNNQGTVDQIRDTAEDLKRRVREFCEKFMNDNVIDASNLTPAQRDALRHELDEQDALDREAAKACEFDTPAPAEEPVSDDDVPVFEPETPAEAPTEEK